MASVPQATPQHDVLLRYTNGAIFLHWLMALLVLTQVGLGFTFGLLPRGPLHTDLFLWHKTVGALILLLAIVRLVWRLGHRPPPFPEEMPRWQRLAAVWNHRAFYLLLILLPLTGLTAVSDHAQSGFTELKFGLWLPVIPGVSKGLGGLAGDVHVALVFVTLALFVLHVAAALKHQLDRDRTAGRMPPFTAPAGTEVRRA
jgi:cytochrome b561